MSQIAISVNNLSKEYRMGTINHGTLYKDIQSWWARLRGKEDPNSLIGHDTSSSIVHHPSSRFLALNDVSFEVKQGEILGIIGRNGAGKSTLLKILSQVTSPTNGKVKLKGRVSSLLEVGTGFHPELTGRENIFLNGAILGMSKAEIRAKFGEIVGFAELDKFIDTPVKRYSSGMYVRLAFAVAAHLEPEILIVDEVLAVGDAQFQKKCLGKMEDVGREGRTVLFVSHNMTVIEHLCGTALLLENGVIFSRGTPRQVIANYLTCIREPASFSVVSRNRDGIGDVEIYDIIIENDLTRVGDNIEILVNYRQLKEPKKRIIECGISIWNIHEVKLVSISSLQRNEISEYPNEGSIRCTIPNLPLIHGEYFLNAFVSSVDGIEDYIVHAKKFSVHESDYFGSGKLVDPAWGALVLDHHWTVC